MTDILIILSIIVIAIFIPVYLWREEKSENREGKEMEKKRQAEKYDEMKEQYFNQRLEG